VIAIGRGKKTGAAFYVCPDQKANDATCLVFRLHSKNNSQSGRPVTTFEKYLVSRIGQDDSVGRISSFGFKEIKTSSFFSPIDFVDLHGVRGGGGAAWLSRSR
jgi:hypothetical protein